MTEKPRGHVGDGQVPIVRQSPDQTSEIGRPVEPFAPVLHEVAERILPNCTLGGSRRVRRSRVGQFEEFQTG